jgi:hypothetical protein
MISAMSTGINMIPPEVLGARGRPFGSTTVVEEALSKKSVLPAQAIDDNSNPLIVLEVNPANQPAQARRLSGRGEVVIWNSPVTR